MYCPGCGEENRDSAAFCDACGRQLSGIGSEQASQAEPEETVYPGGPYRPPMRERVPDGRTPEARTPYVPTYLGWSIVVFLLCFWPTAIVAIVNAVRVSNRLVLGDVAGAQEASRKAKMWCWVSFIIAVVVAAMALLLVVAGRGF